MARDNFTSKRCVRKSGLRAVSLAQITILLFLSVSFPSAAAEKSIPVRIGVLAYRGAQEARAMWGPTAEYLTRALPGHSFSIVPLDFYEIGPAVGKGHVEFVLANTSIYVELEAQYGVTRIATLRNKTPSGAFTVFGGVIFCRAGRSDITGLNDLKGGTFAAAEENSLGGWRVAWRELKDQGIDPFRDFAKLEFSGTHDNVVYAVRDGRVDAGTVRTDTLERMAEAGKIDLASFRVLNQQTQGSFPFLLSTRLYPEWPFAKAAHTSDDLSKKAAIALLSMAPDSPAAKAGKITGWTTPLDYQPVHELMKELRVGPYRDYGRIPLGGAVRQYWYWVQLAVLVMLLMAAAVVHVGRLNRRLVQSRRELEQARSNLEEQVRQRTATLEQQRAELSEEVRQRTQAEEALRQSESRFRGLVEQSLVGIYIIAGSRFLYVNPKLAEIFGYPTPQEIMFGKSVPDLVAPESRALVAENIRKRLSGEVKSIHYVFKGLRKDGAAVDVEAYGTRTEIDGKTAIIGTLLDVTERRRAEAEREEARTFLQSVIDGVSDIIMVVDSGYRVMMMNKAARESAPDELLSKDPLYCYQIFHQSDGPCDDPDEPCALRTVMRTKQPIVVNHTHNIRKDIRQHVEILASPVFDEAGEVAYVIEACRDITAKLMMEKAQKRLQERLFQQQKERSIATLAGGIAHDFNNILMGVVGTAEILKMQYPPAGKQEELINTIIDLSKRMAQLTRQLLAYSKQGAYEQREVSLNDAVREAAGLAHKGASSAVELRLELAGDLWPVFADPGQLGQVIVNLFTNAFEAMEGGGGRLTVRTENVENKPSWECPLGPQHPGGDYVHLSVSDSGPGIPAEDRMRIFEPFFTTKFLGRGLGLAAALGIIRNHNGCITVESEPGRGSTFHIFLPRRRAVLAARTAQPDASFRRKILVVEDEPRVLSLMRAMLAELGFEALLAQDGADALTVFDRERDNVTMAILDIQMPGMDGRQLVPELKSRKPDLKVLVSSGYDEKTALEGIAPRLADGFIQKPYWIDDLREKILDILGR